MVQPYEPHKPYPPGTHMPYKSEVGSDNA
jgi:hypothetical protein